MAILAGWITGEQVPQETIEQVLTVMGSVLERLGGTPARSVQPGAGILSFSDSAYALHHNGEPPLLDWTPERRTLVYRRPLSGLYPLYYIENWPAPGNLLFASEIKALLAVGVPRRLRIAALTALMRYGFLPAPWTFFQDINVVPAGSLLRWQHTRLVIGFSSNTPTEISSSPLSPTPEDIHSQLRETTYKLLPLHNQPTVGLTGGDSASTLALSLIAQKRQDTTHLPNLTIASFAYKQRHRGNGWEYIRRLSKQWHTPLLEISGRDQPDFWQAVIYANEAPCLDTNLLAWHQLLHTAALETHARIAFCGLGASTLLRQPIAKQSETISDLLSTYAHSLHTSYDLEPFLTPDIRAALHTEEQWEQTLHARRLARHAEQLPEQRQRLSYLNLHLRLPDGIVTSVYHLAQQEHLALRSPYLNPHLQTLLATSQDSDLLSRMISALPESGQLPLKLPCSSLWQVEHSELLQSLLSEQALRDTGIFDVEAVQQLLHHPPTQHTIENGRHPLVAICTLQLWCQIFRVRLS